MGDGFQLHFQCEFQYLAHGFVHIMAFVDFSWI